MNKTRTRGVIRENLYIALDVVAGHKLRSGLIILGVAIGVAALMGMVSILLGLGEKIRKDIGNSETPVLLLMKFDFMVGGVDESVFRRKEITSEDAIAVGAECPSIRYASYLVEPQGRPPYTLYYGKEKSRMIQVIGAESTLLHIWMLDLEEGRMFTEDEVSHRAKVVVLGHSPRRDLFPAVDPIGKKVRIGNDEYTVVGTFAERKTLFGSMGENFAAIPHTTYHANLWRKNDMQRAFASLREDASLEQGKEEIIRLMRIRRGLKANQDNDFDVTSTDAVLVLLDRLTGPIAGILAAISSIGLLVGGIGVMNMMLVSVTERTGEIGIRKAVGATNRDILWQFLIEAGSLTGFGGALGVAMGMSAALGVSSLTGLPSQLSPFYVILAVFFSVGIGIFFGLYPANRASRLDPVEAMAYAK